ncbi:unnamed protein product [Dicrocoelium dendriticum]|nr:unnamed protein product [Dicrocoelium dendriticum]
MSSAFDVLDILQLEDAGPKRGIIDKDNLLSKVEKKKPKNQHAPPKRPGNVPREVWGLHSTLSNDLPPLIPTDDSVKYRQPKAVIGVGRVRRWQWTPFTNPAREDGLLLYHWRREKPSSEPEQEYPFARYNKHVTVPEYTSSEYESLLQDPKWSESKTAHLMDLARRFDLRFIHMRDRWDSERFPGRPSVEDLKERYYFILETLDKVRGTNLSNGLHYDAAHERRRKQQLSLLYGRTRDQVEEEQRLVQELRRIEAKRRERERKKQDLQKLISQADSLLRDHDGTEMTSTGADTTLESGAVQQASGAGSVTSGTSQRKRTFPPQSGSTGSICAYNTTDGSAVAPTSSAGGGGKGDLAAALGTTSNVLNSALTSTSVINFPDPSKNPGVHLRSHRMKLPGNLGQKKIRIIENFLAHLQIDPTPPATAEIVEAYNSLRSKILLLYDLRMAQLHCDYELQTARLKLETFAPSQPLPTGLANVTSSASSSNSTEQSTGSMSSSVFSQIDPMILNALRDSDSKRPVVSRHSLGVAGALAAAAGSSGLCPSQTAEGTIETRHVTRAESLRGLSPSGSHSSDSLGRSPSVQPGSATFYTTTPRTTSGSSSVDGSHDGSVKRLRRAAALEQVRVLKKLKIKGQLVD